MTMTVKEALIAARDRIDQSWFKGYWRDDTELPDEECAVCMLGAVRVILSGSVKGILPYSEFVLLGDVTSVLEANLPEDWIPREPKRALLPQYNDDLRTDKGDILALFDRAIESLS